MMRYARIENSAIVEVRSFDREPDPNPAKGLDWRLYPIVPRPSFDSATHHAPVESTGIQPTEVVTSWVAPVAKTQGELDAETDAQKENTLDRFDLLNLKVAFNHENRIRALEGEQPVTQARFRTAMKAML
jgi:hypothetical protein